MALFNCQNRSEKKWIIKTMLMIEKRTGRSVNWNIQTSAEFNFCGER